MDRAEVARKDNLVILTMRCPDDYAAMLLYDKICAEMNAGFVQIELETKPSAVR